MFKTVVRINGTEFDGLLDTGASVTGIGIDDAEKLGIDISSLYFDQDVNTAAGKKHKAMAEVTVDFFQIGPIVVKNLVVGVNRFVAEQCLVGMNFFESLDSFQIEGDVLTLRKGGNRKPHDESVSEPYPRKAASTAVSRVPAECPHCVASMTLPAGREGNVRCHSCSLLFFADTSATKNGKANCRPVS